VHVENSQKKSSRQGYGIDARGLCRLDLSVATSVACGREVAPFAATTVQSAQPCDKVSMSPGRIGGNEETDSWDGTFCVAEAPLRLREG
jgi:hypothetical protein